MAKRVGLEPKQVASTGGGEYHSACPSCIGTDRFYMHPNKKMKNCLGSYRCRKCEIKGDTIQFARDFCGCSFSEAVELANATIPQKTYISQLYKKTARNDPKPLSLPSKKWITAANSFVDYAQQQILQRPEILKCLQTRGIDIVAVKKYKIGWNPNELWRDREKWGLPDNKKTLWLPKGIVIPYIDQHGNTLRLKMRRAKGLNADNYSKYIIIPGSANGLWTIGNTKHKTMVVVESELDAYALHHRVEDFACVVAVGSCLKNPDNVTDYLAKAKKNLIICHDNDEAGEKMLAKWKRLYPKTVDYPTPIGKDIGEAIQRQLNVRPWIIDALPIENKHQIIEKLWSLEDQPIISFALKYIRERTITRDGYIFLEKEIAIGPNGSRAKTGELQKGLDLMKQLISKSDQAQ